MIKNKTFNAALLFLLVALSISVSAHGAENEDEQFIRTGSLSFSKKYILAEDFSYIIFKIKNHNPKTLSQIFGWVYRTPATKEENPKNSKKLVLVNNPHRGGLLVKDGPHRPGNAAQWRFTLDQNMEDASEKDKFTLRVSEKGVFFQRIEPLPLKRAEEKEKDR